MDTGAKIKLFDAGAAALLLIALALGAANVTVRAASSEARDYPVRPIRLVVPNSPGSGADVVSRIVANKLTAALGRQVVIDNRAGASSAIGSEIVATAAPDGYTLLMITSEQAIITAMYDKLGFDLIKDFAGISLLATTSLIFAVHPGVAANSIAEFIALAKAKPGQLNYGSPGAGSTGHLSTELFKSMTGVNLVHVPYKGTGPALTDTIAGHVQLTMLVATALLATVKSGKLRALGISGTKRSSLLPDLPTIAETVPGFQWGGWYVLAAPRGTPREIVARLNAELASALKTADFQERLAALTAEPLGTTPQESDAYMKAQVEKMRYAIKVSGARRD